MLHLQGYIVAPHVFLLQQTWICNFCPVCCSLKCKDTPTPRWFCLSVRCRSLWWDEIWQHAGQSPSLIHGYWIYFILFESFCLVLVTSAMLLTLHSSCVAQVTIWLVHLASLQHKRFLSVLIFHGYLWRNQRATALICPVKPKKKTKGEYRKRLLT